MMQLLYQVQNSVWEGWQINLAFHACDFWVAVHV